MIKKKKMKVVLAAFAGVMLFGGLAFSPNKSQAAKKVKVSKVVADADAKKGILTKKNMKYWGVKKVGMWLFQTV